MMYQAGNRHHSLFLYTFSSLEEEQQTSQDDKVFVRNTNARNTIIQRCRQFYQEKLKRSETFRRQWSTCDVGEEVDTSISMHASLSTPNVNDGIIQNSDLSSCKKFTSSFDLTMDHLRQEIGTLIDQDNDLFRKLLALYDTIAELRDRQQEAEEEEISDNDEVDCNQSLGSLSDPDIQTSTTSPSSTLSSCSCHNVLKKTQFQPLRPRGKSMLDSSECHLSKNSNDYSRCFPNPMLPQYNRRRTRSYGTLYYRNDESPSYDSGIYLQGPHSDSEHEIFV